MARPRKEGLEYFPHDVGARNDDKLAAMRHVYGNDAYAFYWIILEMAYAGNTPGLNLSDKIISTVVRKEIGIEQGLFDEMIATACKLGLFEQETWDKSKVLCSRRIREQFEQINKERNRKRVLYDETPGETGVIPPITAAETPGETPAITPVIPPITAGETPGETYKSKAKQSKANPNPKESKGECLNIPKSSSTCTKGEPPNLGDGENSHSGVLDLGLARRMGEARSKLQTAITETFRAPTSSSAQVLADIVRATAAQAEDEQTTQPFEDMLDQVRRIRAARSTLKNPIGLFVKAAKQQVGYEPRGRILNTGTNA